MALRTQSQTRIFVDEAIPSFLQDRPSNMQPMDIDAQPRLDFSRMMSALSSTKPTPATDAPKPVHTPRKPFMVLDLPTLGRMVAMLLVVHTGIYLSFQLRGHDIHHLAKLPLENNLLDMKSDTSETVITYSNPAPAAATQ